MLRVRCFFRHGSFFPCWHVAKPSPEEAAEPSPEEAPSLLANVGALPGPARRRLRASRLTFLGAEPAL